ncbi:MAG: MFS transporter [Pseudomonadota bacterium]
MIAAAAPITALFFAWGFISANNDPLIAAAVAGLGLSYTEALLVQMASFAAFGLISLPAAALLARRGAHQTITTALAAMVVGCLMVSLAARQGWFEFVLVGLFVLAGGITTLQVAANPLAAALGPPAGSHARLALSQAFNSLGVVVGASFGSVIMLGDFSGSAGYVVPSGPTAQADVLAGVVRAFLIIAALLVALAAVVWRLKAVMAEVRLPGAEGDAPLAALRSGWAVSGALAIGLYVGAEVALASVMISFLSQPAILNVSLEAAGFLLANVYWMGALVGRFAGSWLLTRTPAPRLLMAAAVAATALCLVGAVTAGRLAAVSILAVGLFNSIMFPTIFSITLERSRAPQAATSGLLCLAIAGGAVVPFVVGRIADRAGLSMALFAPAMAYAAVTAFALVAGRGLQAARERAS